MGNEGTVLSLYDQLIKEGYDKGIEIGVEQGVEQGAEANTREIILRGFQNQVPIQTLMLLTGLSESEIQRIIENSAP